ncbi:hypothetical protein [Brevundimonas sp.]|uniref:hypothetical protein n=1 Tax=Brevundimonas sp. TaxID=1871086 RepID=UPI0025DC5E66|nr:hypothetical protein [Brevundimonas sp.]
MSRLSCLAAAASLATAPALAQERPLTDEEVLGLAREEAVWCENWSDQTRDCESLYMLRQAPDGTLVQSGMFLMSDAPAIRVIVAERVSLTNGRLCSSGSTEELNIQATMDGQPSLEATLMVRALLTEAMAEFADAQICQQLFATDDPQRLEEIITADEERLTDFESSYRLGTVDTGFLLRPVIEDEDQGQVHL